MGEGGGQGGLRVGCLQVPGEGASRRFLVSRAEEAALRNGHHSLINLCALYTQSGTVMLIKHLVGEFYYL